MLDTRELQNQLGRQMERVILESRDPAAAMEEIALEAERRGLIDTVTLPRYSNPTEFVMDLWLENPLVLDRLNLHR